MACSSEDKLRLSCLLGSREPSIDANSLSSLFLISRVGLVAPIDANCLLLIGVIALLILAWRDFRIPND